MSLTCAVNEQCLAEKIRVVIRYRPDHLDETDVAISIDVAVRGMFDDEIDVKCGVSFADGVVTGAAA